MINKYITCYTRDKYDEPIEMRINEDDLDLSDHDADLIEEVLDDIREEIILTRNLDALKIFEESVKNIRNLK